MSGRGGRAAQPPRSKAAHSKDEGPWWGSRTWLLTQAFLAWAGFSVLGFLPELCLELYNRAIQNGIFNPVAEDPQSAWAIFTHLCGFAVFLLIMTRKKRWLILPGVSSLWFMWVFKWVHLPPAYWVLATHALGYLMMAVSLLFVMGILSSLLFIWVDLMSFVKNLWVFYPQIKRELQNHPILEKVIVKATGNLPTSSGDSPSKLLRMVDVRDEFSDCCFLCKEPAAFYVGVCDTWTSPSDQRKPKHLSICTPFADLRDTQRRTEDMLRSEQATVERLKRTAQAELDKRIALQADFLTRSTAARETTSTIRARDHAQSPPPQLPSPQHADAQPQPHDPLANARPDKLRREVKYLLGELERLEREYAQSEEGRSAQEQRVAELERELDVQRAATARAQTRCREYAQERSMMDRLAAQVGFYL